MSYLVFARKYRPQTFDDIICQNHITQTLKNAISLNRVPHGVLFSGPRGTGKTTIARILAKAMNCKFGPTPNPCNECSSCVEITASHSVDVFEIDGASNNGVEHIRDLRENIKYMPAHSRYKIYIIDEVHMLSIAAFNALLKTLEEPPSHIMFIFATTEPHKIPITILSRCQRYDLRRVDMGTLVKHMGNICKKEEVKISEEALITIAREASGGVRDALSLLDQIISCTDGAVSIENAVQVLRIVDRKYLFEVSSAVLHGQSQQLINIIDEIYNRGYDIKKFYSDIVEHFRNLLVLKIGSNVSKIIDIPSHEIDLMNEQIKNIPEIFLNQLFDILFSGETSVKYSSQPRIALEVLLIRMCQTKGALSVDLIIEKIDELRKLFMTSPKIEAPKQNIEQIGIEVKKNTEQPIIEPIINIKDTSVIWEKILEKIRNKYPFLSAYLKNSTLKNISDNDIEIEVNATIFNVNMLRREKTMDNLKEVCCDFFGKKIDIKLITNVVENAEIKKEKQNDEIKKSALNHPIVNDVLEIFSGNIVDIKIL
ncbi:MAG: DNA polymerase III subunit gamma/tau [Desulfobacterales bacterium]|nr:DNA polymerase III subunit gamma/tau [Desulfobacterales bacterium]